jgi:molybdopterin/thiamine biosynthesis adenylyltransferase
MRRIPLDNVTHSIIEHAQEHLLPFQKQASIATAFGLPLWEVERHALQAGIYPLRYARNRDTITLQHQIKLLEARVAIVGCGGLGGHVAEMLVRIGVGHLTLVDPDRFDEHNLNRQNFSTLDTLGKEKVYVLKHALSSINPSVQIRPITQHLNPERDFPLIADADVVVDALDNPKVKLELARVCLEHGTAFVHGAIAGMDGQVTVNTTLEHLYHDGAHGAEATAGNLSFSAAFVAAIQAAEAVKQIIGAEETLAGKLLITDLFYDDFTLLPV